jgi:hypothetical protein
MFPKRAKVKLAAQARELERELRAAATLAPAEREAKQRELSVQLEALVESVEDGAGLRLDGTLSHLPSGEQVWYDTTTVHTTCSTKLTAELAFTRKRQAAGKEGKDMQSAGLMAVHQTKLDRYALLAALAERQALDGLRSTAPIILPVAVSTHGEFCPGAVRVQEWLTGKYRARLLLEGDRDDGEKTEDLTAAFRREFRASLLVASCKGLADMLLAAGMPFAGKRAPGWSSASGGRAHAPPPSAPPPPRPPLLSSVRGSEAVELSGDEDQCSTASSSEDNDGEDVAPRALRRSARLKAQTQARTSAAARTPPPRTPPSSSGAACCADSGADSDADSGADGDEDSDADWSSGAGAWRARVQPDSSSSNQDTSISSSSPLSLVICDGFPVVM